MTRLDVRGSMGGVMGLRREFGSEGEDEEVVLWVGSCNAH